MTNDAIATVFIVVLMVLNAWQLNRYERAMKKIESLQSIIEFWREHSGPVWGDMNKVSFADAADDALPEELKP